MLAHLFEKSKEPEEQGKTHWRHVLGAEAEPVLQGLFFGNNFAGGGVGDDSWADFLEDAVGHGVAEEAADIHLVDADLGSNLTVSRCGSNWERECFWHVLVMRG